MLHLQPSDRLFISEDLTGFSDEIVNQGTLSRRIDLVFLGFSYAVNKRLEPAEDYKRHQLIQVASIDADTLLAFEAVAHWYAKELQLDSIDNEANLLEFICSLGITGVRALRERWKNKSKSQIQFDILNVTG